MVKTSDKSIFGKYVDTCLLFHKHRQEQISFHFPHLITAVLKVSAQIVDSPVRLYRVVKMSQIYWLPQRFLIIPQLDVKMRDLMSQADWAMSRILFENTSFPDDWPNKTTQQCILTRLVAKSLKLFAFNWFGLGYPLPNVMTMPPRHIYHEVQANANLWEKTIEKRNKLKRNKHK